MKYASILSALIVFAITSVASAENWTAQPNKYPLTPADVAQLPSHVNFCWVSPVAGWETSCDNTWYPVWPRNASGAWYRQNAYTQNNAIKRNVYTWPYSCQVSGMGFRCLDKVRAIWRSVYCPSHIYMGPMRLWRSVYNSAWKEQGLFTASVGPFSASETKTLALTGVSVTASGQQLNCAYGNRTVDGPGLTTDAWVFRR
jgi:hypothetical protein